MLDIRTFNFHTRIIAKLIPEDDNMQRVLLTIAILSMLHTTQRSSAEETITCNDIADVYIDQLSPDENFNAKTRVLIATQLGKGIARGLFLFDIPDDMLSEEVAEATLYLSGSTHTGGGYAIDVNCYALNTPFDENDDTWNSLSGGDYDNSVFSPGSLLSGNDWETSIDVTTLVSGNLEKVRDYGLLIRLQNEDMAKEYQNIASRESTDEEDFAAYLEIVCSPLISSTTTTELIETTTTSEPPETSTTTTEHVESSTSSTTTTTKPVDTTTTTISVSSTTTITSSTTTTIPTPVPTTTSSSSTTTTSVINICVIESIYGEYSDEVELLKCIRDTILLHTSEGHGIVKIYYELSPVIMKAIEDDKELEEELKETIDEFLVLIKAEIKKK